MNKKQTIELLEKQMPGFYSVEQVITLIKGIEEINDEQVQILTDKLDFSIQKIFDDVCSDNIIDYDSAEFELDYNNTISLTSVNVDLESIKEEVMEVVMGHLVTFQG